MAPALDTDEETEAARALEKTADELEEAEHDTYAWKWAIIALHNAIQALMALRLNDTDSTGALRKEQRDATKKWLSDYLSGKADTSTYPNQFMASFLALHKDSKNLPGFPTSADLEKDMVVLNDYRNDFIHFVPKTWGLMLGGMPDIVLRLLEIASYLVGHEGSAKWNWEEEEALAHESLARIKTHAENLRAIYNP